MRISSSQVYNIANKGMADINQELLKTQEQISSGKRILTPADDPVASTKIMRLTDELNATKQYSSNIDAASNNLSLEESSLNGVSELIQRMQELTLSAGNTASLSQHEYQALASEVDSRIEELLNLANTRNANGDYIFAGHKSSTPPFVGDSLSGFKYYGDEGQQFIKAANNTYIPATDSGKSIFVDIPSAHNTLTTYANPNNASKPPISISVGRVYDQKLYDDFYPEDIVISFNADGNLLPPGKNFTATEKSTGRVLLQNQPYVPGKEIKIQGVAVKITGNPVSGTAAQAAHLNFGSQSITAAHDFSATPETLNIRVAGLTHRFVLDANITNTADLAAVLNNPANGNAAKLAALGLQATSQGLQMPKGVNFSLYSGSANIDTVMGLNSLAGTQSSDGQIAKGGDSVFIESSSKQDVITTLARLSETMKAYTDDASSKKTIAEMVATTLKNLNHAQTSVLNVTAKIGARINTLEATKSIHQDTAIVSQKVLSDISSLDYAEASTRLSQQSMVLQATQQSFIRVSQLSLFEKL